MEEWWKSSLCNRLLGIIRIAFTRGRKTKHNPHISQLYIWLLFLGIKVFWDLTLASWLARLVNSDILLCHKIETQWSRYSHARIETLHNLVWLQIWEPAYKDHLLKSTVYAVVLHEITLQFRKEKHFQCLCAEMSRNIYTIFDNSEYYRCRWPSNLY